MNKIYENRIIKIKDYIKEKNCDGLIVSNNNDLFYLTGFNATKEQAYLLITKNNNYFFTDGRFINQFNQEVENFELIEYLSKDENFKTIKKIIEKDKLNKILISLDSNSYKNIKTLNLKEEDLIDSEKFIFNVRKIKTEKEIKNIKIAASINEKAFKNILKQIKLGMNEKQIKNILEFELMNCGGEGLNFSTIIASGPINGSLPHAVPTDRKIEDGDFITIDFGCVYNRYGADTTRTIAVGKPKKELIDIYNIVLNVKNECSQMVKPGVNTTDVYNHAKNIIEEYGYKLSHGLGHGLGLDCHELPILNASSNHIFEVNNVFTIEPGIYVEGLGGVRIEDDYLLTENGVENLTPNITTELIVI